MKDFTRKNILITGGSSGIGLALAKQLAGLGSHVWLVARGQERLQSALTELEACRIAPEQRFGFTPTDLCDPREAAEVVRQVTQAIGAPDLLVNSAGIVEPGCFADLSLDDFHSQMEVNYFATVYVTRAVLPAMRERGSGSIVNIASMAAVMGVYGYTAYAGSKFAVRGFTEALRSELKPLGIHVMLVYPPDTDTPQLAYDQQKKPPETAAISATASKVFSPEVVAGEIIKGIQRRRFSVVPGFDSKFFFTAVGISSAAIFLLVDLVVARTRRNKPPTSTDGEKP
jgi:3-dehydrosphinganine reductase